MEGSVESKSLDAPIVDESDVGVDTDKTQEGKFKGSNSETSSDGEDNKVDSEQKSDESKSQDKPEGETTDVGSSNGGIVDEVGNTEGNQKNGSSSVNESKDEENKTPEDSIPVTVSKDKEKTWKDYLRISLSAIFGLAGIAAIACLFLVPGAQVLVAPFLVMGVPKVAAIILAVAQFASISLTALGVGRGIVKFTDILMAPVRMVANAVKFVADITLSVFSSILPNKWLAKSYAFLNNVMCKINGVKDRECKVEETDIEVKLAETEETLLSNDDETKTNSLSAGRRVLNCMKNIVFGIFTPVAKTAIFVGNFIFNAALAFVDMYIKPLMPKNWVKKVNQGIGNANGKFNEGMDAVSNSQMDAPVTAKKVYSIKSRMDEAAAEHAKLNQHFSSRGENSFVM